MRVATMDFVGEAEMFAEVGRGVLGGDLFGLVDIGV